MTVHAAIIWAQEIFQWKTKFSQPLGPHVQPAPSMTSLVCSDPSKMVCSDPPRMVCSDPYKVGGALQAILERSLQTKDVIDCWMT